MRWSNDTVWPFCGVKNHLTLFHRPPCGGESPTGVYADANNDVPSSPIRSATTCSNDKHFMYHTMPDTPIDKALNTIKI